MKNLIVLFSALFAIGCSGAESSNPTSGPSCKTLAGHYTNQINTTNTLDLSSDCTFTDNYCGYIASYTFPTSNPGTTVITVVNTNGAAGCMANTPHNCIMEYTSNAVAISCDGGAHEYLFERSP